MRPRSGLALKHGVTVLNSPGTIDSDYRGEVSVMLVNLGERAVRDRARRAHRAARRRAGVARRAGRSRARCPQTERGAGGFGSTGALRHATKTRKSAKALEKKAQPSTPLRDALARRVSNSRTAREA